MPVTAQRVGPRAILVNVEANVMPEAVGGVGLYARVSSRDQKLDLERQVARLSAWSAKAGHHVVRVEAEVGSGMNGVRSKTRRLLADPDVTIVVVEHRDRLGWMNTELVKAVLEAVGRRLVVLDDGEVEDDLVRDMVEVSIKLPAPLAELENARHGRYVLAAKVRFPHRGQEWADRVQANRAVAYRIQYDVQRGRWYITATWQYAPAPMIPMEAALAHGVIGVDTTPPHTHQSDGCGHRTAQAALGDALGREEPRPRIPGPRTTSAGAGCGANAGDQYAQHRSGRAAEQQSWQQDSLPLSLWER